MRPHKPPRLWPIPAPAQGLAPLGPASSCCVTSQAQMALSDTWGVGWGMGLPQLNLREATSPPGPRRKGTNTSPLSMLPPQGDRCLMGQQRSFRKRKPAAWCTKGRSFTSALRTRVCECGAADFLW